MKLVFESKNYYVLLRRSIYGSTKRVVWFSWKPCYGTMVKLAQFKVVRAITAAGMAAVPFTIVGSIFLVFSVCHKLSHFVVWQIFSLLHLINSHHFTWLQTMRLWVLYLFISFYPLHMNWQNLCRGRRTQRSLNGALLALMAFVMTSAANHWWWNDEDCDKSKEGAVIADGWAMEMESRFGTGIFTPQSLAIDCSYLSYVYWLMVELLKCLSCSRGFSWIYRFSSGFVVAFICYLFINLVLA